MISSWGWRSIWRCLGLELHRAQDQLSRHPATTFLPSHRHMSSSSHLTKGLAISQAETLPPWLILCWSWRILKQLKVFNLIIIVARRLWFVGVILHFFHCSMFTTGGFRSLLGTSFGVQCWDSRYLLDLGSCPGVHHISLAVCYGLATCGEESWTDVYMLTHPDVHI